MTLTIDLGILLALACAFASNLAFFYKYRIANAVGSWGLHVAALALAPMSVVQVALAAGVVFIAVMAERMFGFEVGPRQWLGLILTATGLVLLSITVPHMHGAHSH